MRQLLIILAIIFCSPTYAQKGMEIFPIDEMELNDSTYKVIFMTADWCGICKANKRLIKTSDSIREEAKGQFVFYELSENYSDEVIYNDTTYFPDPSGYSLGNHTLIDRLFKLKTQEGKQVYPSFVILDENYKVLGTNPGFTNESFWSSVFGAILNQTASPDSDFNN